MAENNNAKKAISTAPKYAFQTKNLATMGMLSALAVITTYVFTLLPPLVPAAPFLNFDIKDMIILFGAFLYGPFAAVLMSFVVSVIEMFTFGGGGWIGMIMNVVSTCAFVLPACIIYSKRKTLQGAVMGLIAGVLSVTAVMVLWNYLLTPIYIEIPVPGSNPVEFLPTSKVREIVGGMLATVYAPFNLFKGTLNAVFAIMLYKPLLNALQQAKLLPRPVNETADDKAMSLKWIFVIAAMAVGALTLVFMRFA
ncbi:MAG: ECF transporter S component [Oscillospiraceae bacterium]|nr:ECF transporter S component [Oscillospiraceae bacterium]